MYTEDELNFIADAARASNATTNPVWGLNQMFGAMHVYDRLVQIAPNAKARDIAQQLLGEAKEYEAERFQKNAHYMELAQPEVFERLHDAFHPAAGSEADFLISQLALSNRIFAPYAAKPRPSADAFYESGEARERNMKLLFASDLRKAGVPNPKVMAML